MIGAYHKAGGLRSYGERYHVLKKGLNSIKLDHLPLINKCITKLNVGLNKMLREHLQNPFLNIGILFTRKENCQIPVCR